MVIAHTYTLFIFVHLFYGVFIRLVRLTRFWNLNKKHHQYVMTARVIFKTYTPLIILILFTDAQLLVFISHSRCRYEQSNLPRLATLSHVVGYVVTWFPYHRNIPWVEAPYFAASDISIVNKKT